MNGKISLANASKLQTSSLAIFLTEGSEKKDSTLSKIPKIVAINEFSGKKKEYLHTENIEGLEHLFAAGLGKKDTLKPRKFKNTLANVIRTARGKKIKDLTVRYGSDIIDDPYEFGKQIAQGFYLGNYEFVTYKSAEVKKKIYFLENVYVDPQTTDKKILAEITRGLKDGSVISEGIILARELINSPPIDITPSALANKALEIAENSNGQITARVMEEKECRKLGMGSFLAVGQGSAQAPKFITLHYKSTAVNSKKKDCTYWEVYNI